MVLCGLVLGLGACSVEQRASLGNRDSQYSLGLSSLIAEPPRYRQAVFWFQKASIAGHAQAQKQLGRLYLAGLGVEPNLVRAYLWLHLASFVDEEASIDRDRLASSMTREQISHAQALAAEYRKGEPPPGEPLIEGEGENLEEPRPGPRTLPGGVLLDETDGGQGQEGEPVPLSPVPSGARTGRSMNPTRVSPGLVEFASSCGCEGCARNPWAGSLC